MYWECGKEDGHYPRTGVLPPSKPVSQYRCTNLPKTDNGRTHKNNTNTLS